MNETLQKGMLTEINCIKKFIELGYFCSIPYGDSCKYDIIVDINNILYRIQCKSSTWAKDTSQANVAFNMNTNHITVNTKGATRYTYDSTQIDFFYTYFEGEHYLIPIEECEGKTVFRLRYAKYMSSQTKNAHVAENYQLENILNTKILSQNKDKEEVIE